MKILDPGHRFSLATLDGDLNHVVQFVKREGDEYPGNIGTYPGITLQELFRTCISRLRYVNNQQRDWRNEAIIYDLRIAIWMLELRAAERSDRDLPKDIFDTIESAPTCPDCGHIGCRSDCV